MIPSQDKLKMLFMIPICSLCRREIALLGYVEMGVYMWFAANCSH